MAQLLPKMIIDVSYTSDDNSKKIAEILEDPYGLLQRLKMGGIGSPKLSLTDADADDEVSQLMNRDINRNVCNIELRPKGIIVGFRSHLDPYALLMPYEDLEIIEQDSLAYRIETPTNFVEIRLLKRDKNIRKFMERLQREKDHFLASR